MHNLRFRQIHLDFHTSPEIPGIGVEFNKKEWQETLTRGHVNSITCFSKCHHGWSYHPTKVGKMHPHLNFDLLKAQFDACKGIDVNVPVYVSAGVDNVASYDHPEWREVGHDGRYNGVAGAVIRPGFHKMCFNTPYLDYLCSQIEEAVRLFPDADGIWLDIISQGQCCCKWCLEVMDREGLDAVLEEDRIKCSKIAIQKYYERTTQAAKCGHSNMPVFHNSGHIQRGQRDVLKYFSHLELESLPTGGWGYDHFPMSAKYCSKLDHDFLGMTGKFHTTWGEFGGYKHPNALRYECAAMIAFGSKCSVGDQLHPNGKIDRSTYNIIGAAYAEVKEKEQWCENVQSVADVGLLSSDAVNGLRDADSDVGASRMLLEGHILFDILDEEMDFSSYKVMVLPDDIRVDDSLKAKLDAYLADGGKLLLTGKSGLNADGSDFLFDIGAKYKGESEYQPDYVVPIDELKPDFLTSPLVMYLKSQRIKVTTGISLGDVFESYFNRHFKHFCSHQHTPNKTTPSGFDCGVLNNNIMYIAHPVFSIYRGFGAVAYKEYTLNALNKLLGGVKSISTNMPSTARVSLMEQKDRKRYVLHLLHASPISRGGTMKLSGGTPTSSLNDIGVIEELLPLHDVAIEIKIDKPISKVILEPQGSEIPYEIVNNTLKIKLDSFTCHQMVVLQY